MSTLYAYECVVMCSRSSNPLFTCYNLFDSCDLSSLLTCSVKEKFVTYWSAITFYVRCPFELTRQSEMSTCMINTPLMIHSYAIRHFVFFLLSFTPFFVLFFVLSFPLSVSHCTYLSYFSYCQWLFTLYWISLEGKGEKVWFFFSSTFDLPVSFLSLLSTLFPFFPSSTPCPFAHLSHSRFVFHSFSPSAGPFFVSVREREYRISLFYLYWFSYSPYDSMRIK